MQIDRLHFYLEDAEKWRDWFVGVMGFTAIAGGKNSHTRTEVVRSEKVTFVLSSPLNRSSPISTYLDRHPPGIGDVSFCVENIEYSIDRVIENGGKILEPIRQKKFPRGELKWVKIVSIANINHTLVERKGITPLLPEKWLEEKKISSQSSPIFKGIDHLVLNVPAGDLPATVNWYQKALGFTRAQDFTIATEKSKLYSVVMVHPVSGLQFPVNEPRSRNSQIQEFLDYNRGAGVQHLALKTPGVTKVTKKLRENGLSFLSVPMTYYEDIIKKYPDLNLSASEWQNIIDCEILVDSQPDRINKNNPKNIPVLLQIFTKPIFNEPTFFFELIERRDRAKGFGEGNFQALFEAIEREQMKRGNL
ncbi:MAG: 4-hydroxyphenylpyruvate dioxygenase [Prochloraceae cyanobacterium]